MVPTNLEMRTMGVHILMGKALEFVEYVTCLSKYHVQRSIVRTEYYRA
jgi:hypothetical protein